jgi:catechol 2,3-dioxygenase-like lactoylglutathione lyase family enzyme
MSQAGEFMTKKRTGESWIPADEYGRTLPAFTVNLLVSDLAKSVAFYTQVLGAKAVYSDADFAAMRVNELEFMLHADHAYDRHPWHELLIRGERRGLGAELRLFHSDPDALEARARKFGAQILQPAQDMPHGWRDVIVADPDGYTWAVGSATPKTSPA